jgi:hypothetical protein
MVQEKTSPTSFRTFPLFRATFQALAANAFGHFETCKKILVTGRVSVIVAATKFDVPERNKSG